MTVGELKQKLSNLPDDLPVWIVDYADGNDCELTSDPAIMKGPLMYGKTISKAYAASEERFDVVAIGLCYPGFQ